MNETNDKTIFGDRRIDSAYYLLGTFGFIIMGIFCLILYFFIFQTVLLIIFTGLFFIMVVFMFMVKSKIQS